jgi:hypothetical protein
VAEAVVHQPIYKPGYAKSHALVVGIDAYTKAGPLSFAVNDARGVAQALLSLGFPSENIQILFDGDATRDAIMSAYLQYADPTLVGPDDRLLVFFAGHGHTLSGRRDTGFLIPVNGEPSDLSTLIRWDELTRNGDLIAAKHVLFLMDACYGGLAVNRKPAPPGSMRLLEDMMQRYSRQVLASGKPDEPVADGGGVRPGHSLFTAHLLNGLEGAAASPEGVLTGQGIMAYVYEKVGTDQLSQQTPHYGSIDGDGDFIFQPQLMADSVSPKDEGIMVQVPSTDAVIRLAPADAPAEVLKTLLANPADRIRLEDFINAQLRSVIAGLGTDTFATQVPTAEGEMERRIAAYEEVIRPLQTSVLLLAKWAEPSQLGLLEHIFARLAEAERPTTGLVRWIALHWYPVLNLMYVAGISALSAKRFDALRACMLVRVQANTHRVSGRAPLVEVVGGAAVDMEDQFKRFPGLEKRYTPRSDYLFNSIQSVIEDQLFLGRRYAEVFNTFEVMLALTYADARGMDDGRVWGPVGRFAWQRRGEASYSDVVEEFSAHGQAAAALKAGFFGGKPERFKELNTGYADTISQFNFF